MLPLPATTIQPRWERPDQAAVARLFASDRDPGERVRPDDPAPDGASPGDSGARRVADRRRPPSVVPESAGCEGAYECGGMGW
jgi:hypothetical protein